MIIHSRAPLRLGLAGGGTDVSPFSDIFGGKVVNATIDRYAYAEISGINAGSVATFESTDRALSWQYGVDGEVQSVNGPLMLHEATYKRAMQDLNGGRELPLKISTFSDAPVGSGLGASSTLVVAMIKAYDQLLGANLDSQAIADMAFQIERIDCKLAGGKQDQFSAAFGGFNSMVFSAEETAVTPLIMPPNVKQELEANLVLFNTGLSRESARIIDSQMKTVAKSDDSLKAMHRLKDEANQMESALTSGDMQAFVESLRSGWLHKKSTAPMVTNGLLNTIYDAAVNAGASAGKVSGAGGGGFMLFYVPLANRAKVLEALSDFPGTATNCHFSDNGAEAWQIQ